MVLIAPDELRLPEICFMRSKPRPKGWNSASIDDGGGDAELDILYMTRVQKERFLDEEEFNRVKDSFVLDPSKLRTAKSDMIVFASAASM